MALICLFDLWGELGPKINNCEATHPRKNKIKIRGGGVAFTIVDPTLRLYIHVYTDMYAKFWIQYIWNSCILCFDIFECKIQTDVHQCKPWFSLIEDEVSWHQSFGPRYPCLCAKPCMDFKFSWKGPPWLIFWGSISVFVHQPVARMLTGSVSKWRKALLDKAVKGFEENCHFLLSMLSLGDELATTCQRMKVVFVGSDISDFDQMSL